MSEKAKSKLIKYWGREKVRKEQELTEKLAEQEKQGESYEKELELAKFHEERSWEVFEKTNPPNPRASLGIQ